MIILEDLFRQASSISPCVVPHGRVKNLDSYDFPILGV